MFYKFDEFGSLEGTSNIKLDENYSQIDFTDEEIELLNKKYDFIDGEFVKGEKAIAFEIEQKEARKKVILFELGLLKNEKDGMELIGEDTTEIDLKIEELKAEFISLKE